MARINRRVMIEEPPVNTELRQAQIAKLAYELYEQRGCVDGHDWEDWLEAERIINERDGR